MWATELLNSKKERANGVASCTDDRSCTGPDPCPETDDMTAFHMSEFVATRRESGKPPAAPITSSV